MMRIQFIPLVFLVLILSCKEDSTGQELLDEMNAVHEEIEALVNLNCGEGIACKTLPIGAKACGGPTRWIIFSSATDEVLLQTLIDKFTALNQEYNQVTGAISDCSIVNPPEVACVEGICQVVD